MVTVKTSTIEVVKGLRLITPQLAETLLGEPVEGPVFISPQVRLIEKCLICGIKYTPLVYALGKRTIAQHMHAPLSGGIYTQRTEDDSRYLWHTTGIGTDWFEMLDGSGNIICYTFTPKTPPIPKSSRGSNLIESRGEEIVPTKVESNGVIGKIREDGTLSFSLETWERWRLNASVHDSNIRTGA